MKMKIKKGDQVKILSGSDKGRTGIINKVFPKKNQVVVEGINVVKKHVKPAGNKEGGIVEKNAPVNIAKVMLICPECGKPTKVGFQLDKKNKKYRICRKCQSLIGLDKKAKK